MTQVPSAGAVLARRSSCASSDLALAQIGRVEAFREPIVDRGEQRVRLAHLSLGRPQPTQARRRAKLQRLCPLALRNPDGLEKARLRVARPGPAGGRGPPPRPPCLRGPSATYRCRVLGWLRTEASVFPSADGAPRPSTVALCAPPRPVLPPPPRVPPPAGGPSRTLPPPGREMPAAGTLFRWRATPPIPPASGRERHLPAPAPRAPTRDGSPPSWERAETRARSNRQALPPPTPARLRAPCDTGEMTRRSDTHRRR